MIKSPFEKLPNLSRQQASLVCAGVLSLAILGAWGIKTMVNDSTVTANFDASHTRQQNTNSIQDPSDLLDGQWGYLAGAEMNGHALHITSTELAIVKQDGSGGQANPPVNLYGTRVVHTGNFDVQAQVSNLKGKASLQMYGQPPIIADEFRVDGKSVRVDIENNTVTVSVFSSRSQQPSKQATFNYMPTAVDTLDISYVSGSLKVAINNQQLGTISARKVLDGQDVWFGFDATDSWTLQSLKAQPLAGGTLKFASASDASAYTKDPNGLQQLAQRTRKDFVVGVATALGPIVSDQAYATALLGGNFGAITTENSLKWQAVEPKQGVYTFREADALVDIAQKNKLKVHGHTLVFGEANPHWVEALPTATQTDKNAIKQVMLDHIAAVVGHYQGKIDTWDVVNEPFADYDTFDPSSGTIFRNHKWYQAMGKDYISAAFQAAHTADPNAKLFMNEYGLEENGDRWDTFLALIKDLKKQGVPINGVGFQAHVYDASDKIDPAVLKQHIEQLAAIGVQSRISEMDVYDDDGVAVQTQQFPAVFQACFNEPSCIGFTTWGLSDRYDYFIDTDGSVQQGHDFLWDENMSPTLALKALQATFPK